MGQRRPITCRADMRGLPKQLQDMLLVCLSQGWRAEYTAGDHIRVFPPKGSPISTSQTASDRRAYLNWRGQLRRAGLDI